MAVSMQDLPHLMVIIVVLFGGATRQDNQVSRIYELCNLHDDIPVRLSVTSLPFIIRSPNYGRDNYNDSVDCSITIAAALDPLVLLFYFRNFNVEYQQFCSYDYLSLYGIKYCGTWGAGRVFPNFLPEKSISTLRFSTDSNGRMSGFEIIVIPSVAMKS